MENARGMLEITVALPTFSLFSSRFLPLGLDKLNPLSHRGTYTVTSIVVSKMDHFQVLLRLLQMGLYGSTFWLVLSTSFVLTQFSTFLPPERLELFPKYLIHSPIILLHQNLWMGCYASVEQIFNKMSRFVTERCLPNSRSDGPVPQGETGTKLQM